MPNFPLDPRLAEELKGRIERGIASSALLTSDQISKCTVLFRERFGPEVLRALDGEALLLTMHGRRDDEAKCLAYWLEFKNDDEFPGNSFGGIGGGSALKFGIFQRQTDGAWVGRSPPGQRVLTTEEAVEVARKQRDELLAGDKVLAAHDAADTSDEAYERLQSAMTAAAPDLSRLGWSHKYWFLAHSDRLDDYHNPKYQRFHLIKLLQMPPDGLGILDGRSGRFNCAGRFIEAARELNVHVSVLDRTLNARHGSFQHYWKIGTTAGSTGESQWPVMKDGGFIAIGWRERVPNLSELIGLENVAIKDHIRNLLLPSENQSAATRRAGEILNFAKTISENDLVLACEGQTVLGVGRVRGPYEYDGALKFPHKRAVDWISTEKWQLAELEGPRTVVYELGKSARNLLDLETRLFDRSPEVQSAETAPRRVVTSTTSLLPPLDPITARIESNLKRKGQVILYGPPGTGKTFQALQAARELASRHVFRKTFASLSVDETNDVVGAEGMVKICTFHPGYGYEDFIEGLRPTTTNGQMVFEPRDGIFKRMCAAAALRRDQQFYLVIDEINRGDVPRIFGELITAIEHDKRGLPIVLPVTASSFSVPTNVHLIGTMNTADRSISLLDTALRRRFGFIELMPDSALLSGRVVGGLPLRHWLDALNKRIRDNLKRDARSLQIGHAYFLPNPPITSVAEFSRIIRDDIFPLLEEYCYDDVRTLENILGSNLIDVDGGQIREELFSTNREDDLIQALSFEEMQGFALREGLQSDGSVTEPPDDVGAEEDDQDVSDSKI